MPKPEPLTLRRTTITAPQYGLPRLKPLESMPSAARRDAPPPPIATETSGPLVQFKRRKTIAGAGEPPPPASTNSRADC